MKFTWDDRKNRSNIAKHGFSFEFAARVFDDPYQFTDQDREMDGEPRWQTLGMVNGVHILLVVHVNFEEDGLIRIISARKTTPKERKKYAEEN